ncbi:unnamed protein product [Malus baccata var. baccata]
MVEDAQDSESPLKEAHDIQSQIKSAMQSRVPCFKELSEVYSCVNCLIHVVKAGEFKSRSNARAFLLVTTIFRKRKKN